MLSSVNSFAAASAWGDLLVQSDIGSPLNAELTTIHTRKNINATCFSVKSISPDNPVILDFTLTEPMQGQLRLWTVKPLETDTRVTVINRCQHANKVFVITTDNQVLFPEYEDSSVSSPPESTTTSEPITSSPEVPHASATQTEAAKSAARDALQIASLLEQLTQLQQQMQAFRQQLTTLYQQQKTQNQLMHQWQTALLNLRTENHWLRMIVFSLAMMLLMSAYFFADWLRRTMADSASETHSPVSTARQQPSPEKRTASIATPLNGLDGDKMETAAIGPRLTVEAYIAPTFAKSTITPSPGNHASTVCAPAITRLQQHLHKNPKQSPRVWLYLLDKLKREGQQTAYATAANNCKQYFNLQIPSFDDTDKPSDISLESFPRLCETLQSIWGTAESLSFIDDLIFNARLVPRIGFHRQVFEELLTLRDIVLQTLDLAPATSNLVQQMSKHENLKALSALEQEISSIPTVSPSAFQYWSEFTFELDEYQARRKLA